MKGCKRGSMPPCYGSLEFAIHEEAKGVKEQFEKDIKFWGAARDNLLLKLNKGGFADETHDKVYELNKQMCDIDKHLSEAGYFGMICEGQVEARKKLKDMEKKKTKKMTKAEAFEYLKRKKVFTKDKEENIAIQKKLFQCGCKWLGGGKDAYNFGNYMLISDEGNLMHCGYDEKFWLTHYYDVIGANEILSIEIVDGEDNIAEKNAFQQARDIMKWLREEQSPHTLMIIDGYHVELLDGVKAEVWKE